MVQRSKINQARRYPSKDKGNPSKPKTGLIKIISEKKVVCYELGLDVDKETYEAIVEAGRIHISNDKDALFQYAMSTAIKEAANGPV
jgi:hypothetical protein